MLRSIINKNLYNLNVDAPVFAREIETNKFYGLFTNYYNGGETLYASYLADASNLILDLKSDNDTSNIIEKKLISVLESKILDFLSDGIINEDEKEYIYNFIEIIVKNDMIWCVFSPQNNKNND